jgi:hypothetical protein
MDGPPPDAALYDCDDIPVSETSGGPSLRRTVRYIAIYCPERAEREFPDRDTGTPKKGQAPCPSPTKRTSRLRVAKLTSVAGGE